jgi:outer membrane protein OmpA-like peptidoglycan-associated protein
MKYYLLIIILLFINSTVLQAQINKGKKLAAKEDFEEAIEAFENDLDKNTSKPFSLEELSNIYFNKRFKGYNIEKAYKYITRSMKEYDELSSDDRKKIQSKGYSKIGARKHQSNITIAAQKDTEKTNTLAAAKNYLKIYKAASKRQIENITKLRDKLAFAKAKKQNSFTAYESFFEKYEVTCEQYNRALLIKAQKKLLESYIAEKGWALYPSFEDKYTENIYVKDPEAAYALIKIVRKKSLQEYKGFIDAYPHSPFNKFAEDYMFDLIMEGTYLPDYDHFVRAHPNCERNEEIWLKFYRLYLQEHGTESVEEFATSYPNYPFQDAIKVDIQNSQNKKDQPLYERALKDKDIIQILDFINSSPSSPFIVQLEETMRASLQKRPLFRGCKKFLTLFPNSTHYHEILDLLYEEYVKGGELVSINQFMMEYPEYKDINKQKEDLKIAEEGWVLKLEAQYESKNKRKFEDFIRSAAPKERAYVALLRMIEADIMDKNWGLAIAQIDKLAPAFGEKNPRIIQLKELLSAKTLDIKKTVMSTAINSQAHEYVPLISVNNKFLYFCRLDNTEDINPNNDDENIYVSSFKDGKWQPAEYLKGVNTHNNNEGPLAISADNRHLIIFKGNLQNGDMQIAKHTNKGWSKAESFPNTINTPSWDADALISSDGNALLYVSERKEVLDLKLDGDLIGFHGSNTGNRDIFVSLKDKNGAWQIPINLGDIINTPFAERTPFLHPDMKTLYFSSDGHGGLGRLDVYKTTRLDDSWTNWSTPVNLGKSINTARNDWGYRVSTDGKIAYFAATNKDLNEDIYTIDLPKEFQPALVSTISGHIIDRDGNPLDAEIIWEDMETGDEVGRLKSNPTTGEFFIALPNDRQYSYFVFKEHYFPKSNHIDLKNTTTSVSVEEKLSLIKIDEMVEHGISLPLKNLFFETGKYNIKPHSDLELNRLAELIKKYDLTLIIAGHTDDEGSNKVNLDLSQSRANEVKKHLLEKGCKASKIEAKGFGETKPVASNKTEDGRKHNRRVEVRFSK